MKVFSNSKKPLNLGKWYKRKIIIMEKIYFNSLKGKKTKYGVRVFGKVDDVIAEIMKHEKHGWINLELKERREPDKHNCTHYLIVSSFEKEYL
jgi:hypothetical protein